MRNWFEKSNFNPFPTLLSTKNKTIYYFVKRNHMDEKVGSIKKLWELTSIDKIIKNQKENNSWKYPSGKEHIHSAENYNQIEKY